MRIISEKFLREHVIYATKKKKRMKHDKLKLYILNGKIKTSLDTTCIRIICFIVHNSDTQCSSMLYKRILYIHSFTPIFF